MQDLVVTWFSGSESTAKDHIECLRYDSVEVFHDHLHEAVKRWLEATKKWHDNCKFEGSAISLPPHQFSIAGKQFSLLAFINFEPDVLIFEREVLMPEIYTLEEWFNKKLNDEI